MSPPDSWSPERLWAGIGHATQRASTTPVRSLRRAVISQPRIHLKRSSAALGSATPVDFSPFHPQEQRSCGAAAGRGLGCRPSSLAARGWSSRWPQLRYAKALADCGFLLSTLDSPVQKNEKAQSCLQGLLSESHWEQKGLTNTPGLQSLALPPGAARPGPSWSQCLFHCAGSGPTPRPISPRSRDPFLPMQLGLFSWPLSQTPGSGSAVYICVPQFRSETFL